MGYGYLAFAIISEVIGTLALKESDGFSNSTASTICVVAYMVAFYFLSLVLKTIPVGIAYALWAGIGIFLIALLGTLRYRQTLDLPALLGMGLILAGVVVINLFSSSAGR